MTKPRRRGKILRSISGEVASSASEREAEAGRMTASKAGSEQPSCQTFLPTKGNVYTTLTHMLRLRFEEISMSEPDYRIGYPATLTPNQQPQTLLASITIGLNLREIAIEAARAAGMNIRSVDVEIGQDASDEPAYFFNYEIPQDDEVSGNMRSRLLAELRDRLLAHGASHYPYVKLASS